MPRKKKPELTVKQRVMEAGWLVFQMGGLVFFSWLNAANFDQTEIKMLGEFAVFYKLLSTLKGYTE
jgi:hypothetical protein